MKKTVMSLLLMLCLFGGAVSTVHAETISGGETKNWQVVFTTDSKMESNFKTADLDEVIYGLQPGDDVNIAVRLKNENSSSTDWYMTNEVLYSLEDRSPNSGTKGGAYTYELTYTDKNGAQYVLYSSDTVGGEVNSREQREQGLREATNALDEYFYLDTLATGQSGKINLRIALDGETQGNDYQDTLADLQMNFGVELSDGSTSNTSDAISRSRRASTGTSTGSTGSVVSETELVRTGDEINLVPYYIASGISGGLLLFFAFYNLKQNKKETEEEKGGLAT